MEHKSINKKLNFISNLKYSMSLLNDINIDILFSGTTLMR